MTISAIGAAGSAYLATAASTANKPESGEIPGTADHDHDADNRAAAKGSGATGAASLRLGQLNLKA